MSLMDDRSAVTSSFALLSFHWGDKLRFLQFPESIYAQMASDVIRTSWPPGIQEEKMLKGPTYEYKLKGMPFGLMDGQDAVGGRRLVRDMLAALHSRGWVLTTPVHHSSTVGVKDSLILQQKSQSLTPIIPPPVRWLILSFSRMDRIRVIYDAASSSDVSVSHGREAQEVRDELDMIIQNITTMLEELNYFQKGEWTYDSYEFKCKGHPWSSIRTEKTVESRIIVLRLMEILHNLGWLPYGSIMHRQESDKVRKSDTLYFVRPRH
jgi:hypothetical protein